MKKYACLCEEGIPDVAIQENMLNQEFCFSGLPRNLRVLKLLAETKQRKNSNQKTALYFKTVFLLKVFENYFTCNPGPIVEQSTALAINFPLTASCLAFSSASIRESKFSFN
ncbi:MAG: hypothetical protein UR66_C0009G0082 [Candidatus Moranbacteria bacterium GW2011_GWE1_35_17]|nr:MAG: hypothetical protein UR66_C0009G0082 [Candidatus Moranbacteria bacterium GW2011_GWE1_35_17]KKP72137.1 MAG: hypothetical protein UR65_C0020G0003 [Candidatus Moranbacteria bacterium GW2011_GWE2_35_164]KKP83975.1 MAG: hypothetical protein UR83_C0029G0008 [Candidatus Moranbacteria bacterium GW2011_GWF2_35_54]KKP84166.1 MAG: hypothetical protein UR82_C0011G0014 [Candidatus Moranbacteria bacterium GW2011_GWF1_35_5]